MKTLALAAILAASPLVAAASDGRWFLIGESDIGTYEVDTETVRVEGAVVTYWSRSTTTDGKTVVLQRTNVNCTRDELRVVHALAYHDGEPVDVTPNTAWIPLAPGTLGESAARRLCRGTSE